MTKLPAAPAVVMTDVLADEDAYLQAVAQARTAAEAYHGSAESGLDDETYDRLLRGIAAWESEHPPQTAADSPSGQVGAGVTDGDVPPRCGCSAWGTSSRPRN